MRAFFHTECLQRPGRPPSLGPAAGRSAHGDDGEHVSDDAPTLTRMTEASLATTKPTRVASMKPCEMRLALAGTAHTDVSDVSSDKYRYLAEATTGGPDDT
jgi:hypothetical protein